MRIERLQSSKAALSHFERDGVMYTLMPSKVALSPCVSCQCAASPKNCTSMEQYQIEGDFLIEH